LDFWDWVNGQHWVRFVAGLLPVLVTGVLLAPRFGSSSYPTDSSLVGTPAREDLKAPFDVTVLDADTTERLRTEAERRVPTVYDYDTGVGLATARQLGELFRVGRRRVDLFLEEHPDAQTPERLSKAQRARLETTRQTILIELKPEMDRTLGQLLTVEDLTRLWDLQFDEQLEQAMRQLVIQLGTEPFVERASFLEPEQERGIAIQRVPSDGSREMLITDLGTISDRLSAKPRLLPRLQQVLPHAEAETLDALAALVLRLARPNLTPNRAATEVARQLARLAVKPVKLTVQKGEMVIRDGERFTPQSLLILAALNRGRPGNRTILIMLGGALVALVLLTIAIVVFRGRAVADRLRNRDLVFLALLFAGMMVLARLWLALAAEIQSALSYVPSELYLVLIPVAAGAMVARLCVRGRIALTFGVFSGFGLGLLVEADRGFVFYAVAGAALGATALKDITRRSDLLRAGLWVGVGQMAMAVALMIWDGPVQWLPFALVIAAAFVSGVAAGVFALAMTPVVETVFGYTTNLALLELANLNHPALKELIVQAPGSYHHSVIVGSLVEAAAEAINANPLLARVMAYYHDIGKCRNPSYFSENQRDGHNPHDKLKPSMSAMILRRHVSDGLDIAREHRLGEEVMAGISEHHGTTLMHFFYQKAKEAAEEGESIAESDFRYDFHKPQTREAALVMLADAVEAASASVADPTPARLVGVANRVINLRFSDGQLDECDLTLRDLHNIAKAFGRVLSSIYHERPEYPGLLTDIAGKKQNGNPDDSPHERPDTGEFPPETSRPDNLKRLGLDGR